MDVTPYLEMKIAPQVVFDALEERRTRPRFMLAGDDGDWVAVTWGAYAAQIRRVTLFLKAVGAEMTDRACIFAHNRVEWMSAALGVQAAGGVMVPIYPASTAEQAAYVVEHSDAKVVFVDGEDLLARVLRGWAAYDSVKRVVLMDDALDATKVLQGLRSGGDGEGLPSASEVQGARHPLERRPAHRPVSRRGEPDGARRDDGGDRSRSTRPHALHVGHHRSAQGGAAHPPQRRYEWQGLARVQRAASRRGRGRSLVAPDESHLSGSARRARATDSVGSPTSPSPTRP